MAIEVRVHPTAKRAVLVVGFAVAFAGVLLGARKLSEDAAPPSSGRALAVQTAAAAAYIAPIVSLTIGDAALESAWSAALAVAIGGRTEVPVANGRVDVLSDIYAIEVDRLDKWHEGIGQAAHYAQETGKVACLALIVDSDRWPLNEATLSKLRTIERTALARGVKILLLKRARADA